MDETFALSFKDRRGEWHFIPTVPEARKWRGPFATETHMQRACESELGGDVTITRTRINGRAEA